MNRRTFLTSAAAATAFRWQRRRFDSHHRLPHPSVRSLAPAGRPVAAEERSGVVQNGAAHRYRRIAVPLGIVGAIEVEASPWFDDNQWVLDIAAKDKIVVGTIGDLEPDKPAFRRQLDTLHKNPLFRGIRDGNLWDRDFTAMIGNAHFTRPEGDGRCRSGHGHRESGSSSDCGSGTAVG